MNPDTAKIIQENVDRIKKEKIQTASELLLQMETENNSPKKYFLNISTIETLEDVKMILAGLDLSVMEDDENFKSFKKYFTIQEI
jgi:hypothetical protein